MFGTMEIIFSGVAVAAVLIIFILARRSHGVKIIGPALVLRKFDVNTQPADGTYVHIVGRRSGLISWLMTVLRLEVETSLIVTGEYINYQRNSLSGQLLQLTPIKQVASTHCGYFKPIAYLFLCVAALIGAVAGATESGYALAGGLILAIIFLVEYILSKKMVVAIESSGGAVSGIAFKRSVIENVAVDIQRAQKAIKIINTLACREDPDKLTAVDRVCRNCGTRLEEGSTFCPECGNKAGE